MQYPGSFYPAGWIFPLVETEEGVVWEATCLVDRLDEATVYVDRELEDYDVLVNRLVDTNTQI